MSSPLRSPGEEPLIKKMRKKKMKPSPEFTQTPHQSSPIPSLPDDLLLSCFARISRLHYPSLSLVSKRFRSFLASPELYETRSLIGRTESCLYLCLRFPPDPNPRWFVLCQKPNRMKKKKSSGNLLVPIPNLISPPAHWAGVVSVGSSIYAIGGPVNSSPSSDVWVLDCRCHVWRKAPSMRVERKYPAANVLYGKIYVAGGWKDCSSSNRMEVFDLKTQSWEPVLSPIVERFGSSVYKSAGLDGTIYMFWKEGLAYKPKDDKWEAILGITNLDLGWTWMSYCVIDNVLYCCSSLSGLKWYDSKRQYWMNMKGLTGLPKFASYGCVKMADYGGKLAVFWTKYFRSSGYKETRIWCAVIVLERPNSEEIWGTVEWLDPVLTIPNSFHFVCALAATV